VITHLHVVQTLRKHEALPVPLYTSLCVIHKFKDDCILCKDTCTENHFEGSELV
jgi:hypothetical protein